MHSRELKDLIMGALAELKGRQPVALDVREMTDLTDYMVVASGTSDRHVKALAENVRDLAKRNDVRPLGVEGQDVAEWILVDFGDVVVHVMLPATRDFYDLERLWSGAPGPLR